MRTIELILVMILAGGGIGIIVLRARRPRMTLMPSMQVLVGLVIGLVMAFVVVSLNADLIPDDVEWAGVAALWAIAGLSLAVIAYRALRG